MRALFLLPFVLAACSGDGDDDPTTGPDLSDTYGEVDGTLTYGSRTPETIQFGSGVAYGNSFFHGDNNVLVLTQWDDSQCGNGDFASAWEANGGGYKLDIAFDDDGNVVEDESILWSCNEPKGSSYGGCGGAAYPTFDLSFDSMELEAGGTVKGSVTVEDGKALTGTLDFTLTFCGDD